MSFTLVITEAAHQWGLDNYSTGTHPADAVIWGNTIFSTQSWGEGYLMLGENGVYTVFTANGYTIEVSIGYNNFFYGDVTRIEVANQFSGEVTLSMTGKVSIHISDAQYYDDTKMLAGNDSILGNSYNNILQGWLGDDQINGGAGIDTVVLEGLRGSYFVSRSGNAIATTGPDGNDNLINVERVKFDDFSMAFDTAGNGGQAYRLYQAAFNRTPDLAGLGYQINALDSGASLKAVAQNFIDSPEFAATYGNLSNANYITELYENVLHRAPDAPGMAYQQAALASGSVDRAQLLANFSESPENQAALIGTIQNGMVYTI